MKVAGSLGKKKNPVRKPCHISSSVCMPKRGTHLSTLCIHVRGDQPVIHEGPGEPGAGQAAAEKGVSDLVRCFGSPPQCRSDSLTNPSFSVETDRTRVPCGRVSKQDDTGYHNVSSVVALRVRHQSYRISSHVSTSAAYSSTHTGLEGGDTSYTALLYLILTFFFFYINLLLRSV